VWNCEKVKKILFNFVSSFLRFSFPGVRDFYCISTRRDVLRAFVCFFLREIFMKEICSLQSLAFLRISSKSFNLAFTFIQRVVVLMKRPNEWLPFESCV